MSKGEELSVVNFLMNYVQSQENMDLIRKSVQYLVKQLEERNNELNSLITVVCTSGALSNDCVTLPRPASRIWPIAGHFVSYPHVLYVRIWRWPDLLKDEVQHVEPCKFGFDLGNEQVCINPYHYEKKLWMRNEATWFNRRSVMKAFQDHNFVNDLFLTRKSKLDVWPITRTLNHLTLFNLPEDILDPLLKENRESTGISLEAAIRGALRFMEEDDVSGGELAGRPRMSDVASSASSSSEQSCHSTRQYFDSSVPSTSSAGQGRSRFTDDSTGSQEIGGVKKKIWRQDSLPVESSQEVPQTDPEEKAKNEKFDASFNLNKLDQNVTEDILSTSVEFFAEDKVMTKSVLESRRSPTRSENEELCIFQDMDSPVLGPLATLAIDCAMTPVLEDEEELELYYLFQERENI